jgi:hypothetical protein
MGWSLNYGIIWKAPLLKKIYEVRFASEKDAVEADSIWKLEELNQGECVLGWDYISAKNKTYQGIFFDSEVFRSHDMKTMIPDQRMIELSLTKHSVAYRDKH